MKGRPAINMQLKTCRIYCDFFSSPRVFLHEPKAISAKGMERCIRR